MKIKRLGLIFLIFVISHSSFAIDCSDILLKLIRPQHKSLEVSLSKNPEFLKRQAGAAFLHKQNGQLHQQLDTNIIEHGFSLFGSSFDQAPINKIAAWTMAMEDLLSDPVQSSKIIKSLTAHYQQFVIKVDEVPQGYYDLQVRIAREQGHGNIVLSPEQKLKLAKVVVEDQKKSLQNWIDFIFTSPESKEIPVWEKLWVMDSVVKLSKLDKETWSFNKGSNGQVAPFPEVNLSALKDTLSLMRASVEGRLATNLDSELKSVIASGSFRNLYAFELKQQFLHFDPIKETKGLWKKYDQGSDPDELVQSLEGKNTGWCTAGRETACSQLNGGDFYVYYSLDQNAMPSNPRIAIRMDGHNKIGEIRGVAPKQEFDHEIAKTSILKEKLNELGENEANAYLKKEHDVKLLTLIDEKQQNGIELSIEELRFLYEIDEKISTFGHQADPRINEIKAKRNIKNDLSKISGYALDEVGTTEDDLLTGKIKYYYGNLDLSGLQSAKGLKLPETMNGNLDLSGLQSAEGLKLPETMNGDLNLYGLKSAEGLILPETMNGGLCLYRLQSAEGLKLPATMNGNLNLNMLQSAEGLKLPETMNGNLDLRGLQSAEGLKLPTQFNGELFLSKSIQEEVEALKLFEHVQINYHFI